MSSHPTYRWVTTNAPVATSRTDDIWFFDADTGWLVNSSGEVQSTADGGDIWTPRFFLPPSMPGRPYLRCMGWANRQVGWFGAVTNGRPIEEKDYIKFLLHKTTDGGDTWTAVPDLPKDSPAGVCGFFAVDENVAYGSGTNDPDLPGPGILKTTDGGTSWQLIDMAAHADNLIDIYFQDADTGWVVGGKKDPSCPATQPGYEGIQQYAQLKPVVLKTTDGGATWVNTAAGTAGFECGEWGWKIQFLNERVGFVSLENFRSAAILKTTDCGNSWTRHPVADAGGNVINVDLEGIGFVDENTGWVGGWGNNFEGLFNSFTQDGGVTWVPENHTGDPLSDPRIRINRYRFLGCPVTAGYCSGLQVYKLLIGDAPQPQAAVRAAVAPAETMALSHVPRLTDGTADISYTLHHDSPKVYVGIWNHFAVHVRTLVDGPQVAGRHTIHWDGKDDDGKRLAPGQYICRMSVDDARGESQLVRLP